MGYRSIFVPDVFTKLRSDSDFFVEGVGSQLIAYCQDHGFAVDLSERGLLDAYALWIQDLRRIETFELGGKPAEEFKQCAHLAYWLRRSHILLTVGQCEEPETDEERDRQEFFLAFGAQYCALMIGFELCAYAIANEEGSDYFKSDFSIDADYTHVMCNFLKTKEVSPHAMFLIYKSLFYDPLKKAA